MRAAEKDGLMEAFEYAIKKTSATTPSSVKWTTRGSASCGKSIFVAGFLVLVLLVSAWQHFELLRHGYEVEELQRQRTAEDDITAS